MKLIIFVAIGFLFLVPFVRFFIIHLHLTIPYSVFDVYTFIKEKRWKRFNYFGIDLYIGMFGHGKTLSMTHKALSIYERFGDQVQFISNYHLNDIPYEKLKNFSQLVDLGETDSDYIGTVVLIDEIENVLNNRNFASFPLALLHMLTQQRKKHVYILCSAQRFFMVDKLFRSITTNVIECDKFWRYQRMRIYDAWDYENAMNPKLVQSKGSIWWFVRNKDFNAYDTEQMISKSAAEEFISNQESLDRKGFEPSNIQAVNRTSPYYKRTFQNRRK